ncbi:N-acetylmuramoyl-L-alanine amidase [Streptomyces sp. Act143]|uniref:peptidoglycan recognition protein family protein n=1 Tax=Streptomyces sp. Act143 TaxID=2200760 RepID=UPI000D682A77|nr:peptidoglycan recognition protein [Streptomyces sp. Act143]PWI20531.1 N-acetylmuramoyl-L-alanine amidase [Streptomyces sp. Act143]
MRGFLASSIGVTCAVALALPLTPPAAATVARPAPSAEAAVPGSTQSLPLTPLGADRSLGSAAVQGLPRRDVHRFSMVGVVWDDPDTALHGRVQVRARTLASGTWSPWQDVETHYGDDGADPGTPERAPGRVRGATAPLWVGDSDGVEVRVRAGAETREVGAAPSALPTGLRLELVDPGEAAVPQGARVGGPRAGGGAGAEAPETVAASAANADLVALGATEIPALDRAQTERELFALRAGELTERQRAKPKIGPRPRIVTRRGWGANEKLREKKFVYTKKVKAAFVHHTATGNGYRCSQAPSVIRGIYRYHVKSMGWRDIGYNFLVDKCGRIYEGRAGGVAKPVLGAHTLGFNTNSMGVAVLGTFGSARPTSAAVKAVARLTAWKLGLYGADPSGKTYLKSGGGNLYRKGRNVRLNVISGHRDGFSTACPGRQLYRKLGSARSTAARYQGR